jgi:hypothetical protein
VLPQHGFLKQEEIPLNKFLATATGRLFEACYGQFASDIDDRLHSTRSRHSHGPEIETPATRAGAELGITRLAQLNG